MASMMDEMAQTLARRRAAVSSVTISMQCMFAIVNYYSFA